MSDQSRIKKIREQIAFAAADTICFFAPAPAALTKLQQEKWCPVIEKVNGLGCDFKVSDGLDVSPLSQRTNAFLEKRLGALTDESLDAFCVASGGCKSVILALSVLEGFLSADQAFDLSVLEETYQNQFWSVDEEAVTARENRKKAVMEACKKLKG